MVYRCECAEFLQEFREEWGWEGRDCGGYGWSIGEDNGACHLRIRGEKAPVDVGAVADVGVVAEGGGCLEDFLDEALGLGGGFEEEFDDCGEDLELCLEW